MGDSTRLELLRREGKVGGEHLEGSNYLERLRQRVKGGSSMDEIQAGRIAEEAAVKASELTGSRIAEQVAKELSGGVLHQSPISEHCEAVLAEPPRCYDFRGIRSFVLCRAWDIMEKEKRTRLPVGEAWSEARTVCVRE